MEKCKNVKMLKYADLNNEQLKSTAKYFVFFFNITSQSENMSES